MGKDCRMVEKRLCAIHTQKYEVDLGRLMQKRLCALYSPFSELKENKSSAALYTKSKADELLWCKAAADMIQYDIAYLELAERARALPLTMSEKTWILKKAAQLSRRITDASISGEIQRFYENAENLNVEGFIIFRAPRLQSAWDGCIREAAEELLLETEYMELIGVLSGFVRMQEPRVKNIYIVLHPDGGCTLTDDRDARINYANCAEDGIISVLVSLAPEHITVYDLSGGKSTTLTDVLLRVLMTA